MQLKRSAPLSLFTRLFTSSTLAHRVHIDPCSTAARRGAIEFSPKRLLFAALCSCFAGTLTAGPAHAYRTAGELDEFAGTARVRWRTDKVRFVLNLEGAPRSIEGGAADVMLEAMRQWNEPMCSSLEFQPAGVTRNEARAGDGVNNIAWVRDWEARGFSGDAPGTADVQYERVDDGDWYISEVDIYLDARTGWRLRPSADQSDSEHDLLSVLTHELGHAAGLLHPCEPRGREGAPKCSSKDGYEELTMYPIYSPDQSTLERDDERGVCFLYEQDTCKQLGCNTGYACTDKGCERLCGDEVCEVGSVCVDDECIEPCVGLECTNPSCKKDKDCPDTLRCNGTRCVPGLGALGDPCATPRDCSSQGCSKNGICMPACQATVDCNPDCRISNRVDDEEESGGKAAESRLPVCKDVIACRSGVDGSRVCEAFLGAMGDECSESNECLGNQCVADALETPVCTRRCGEGEPECPLDWTCDLVEGRAVCLPPLLTDDGCSIADVGAQSPPRNPWALGLLGLVLALPMLRNSRGGRTEAKRC